MRTVNEILDKIKQIKGLKSDAGLAQLLNVKPSTVANWRARKTLPFENIVAFCEDENINISWLLTGQITTQYIDVDGQKVLTTAKEHGLYKKEEKPLILREEPGVYGDFVYVPMVSGKISAGGGLIPDTTVELKLAFKRDWIQRHGDPRNMSLIRVSGDSMEPTLYSGDIVLVDHNRNYIDPHGGIYAIAMDDIIMIKRLQMIYPVKKIRIISDNPKYEPLEAEPEQVIINGKVIWFGREIER